MNFIFNETAWAKSIIDSGSLTNVPFETLVTIAKYYIHIYQNKHDAEIQLKNFMVRCNNAITTPICQKMVDGALSIALNRKLIDIECVEITDTEMDIINNLNGRQLKRLAFTVLCIAKYNNAVNSNNNNWINVKDSQIMSMANINTSIKRQCAMYQYLEEQGLLSFPKKINTRAMRVNFVSDGNVAYKINDFRNLGYQYLMYIGEPYFRCCNCGIATKRNNPTKGGRQKYCKDCAFKIALQQKVNYAMKRKIATAANA